MKAIIVPGNGCQNVHQANWYKWLHDRLVAKRCFDQVILRDMPDPDGAKRSIWLPFLLSLGAASDTVLVGHSSGAVATMRLLENHRLHGAVIVSGCHTDLGYASEAAAGYYPPSGGEWQWDRIRANAGPQGGNIRILHSDNDPFIPLAVCDLLNIKISQDCQ
eukprot:6178818-Pleurochrysis_carterae.AAC.3